MKIEISTKRLREIIQEELQKQVNEENKNDPEFIKYIVESLKRKKTNRGNAKWLDGCYNLYVDAKMDVDYE